MGEFEDMLNSILSSPREMEKIMGLARELSGDSGTVEPDKTDRPEVPDLGDISPKMLGTLAKLMGELKSGRQDDKTALVASMKPYLRPQRREALDKAVKIARLARVARIAMNELGGDLDLGL